jgi:hypothetical protein
MLLGCIYNREVWMQDRRRKLPSRTGGSRQEVGCQAAKESFRLAHSIGCEGYLAAKELPGAPWRRRL